MMEEYESATFENVSEAVFAVTQGISDILTPACFASDVMRVYCALTNMVADEVLYLITSNVDIDWHYDPFSAGIQYERYVEEYNAKAYRINCDDEGFLKVARIR